MARSDLLVSLVRASASGDRKEFVGAVEAIVAEERAKQHNILADRLTRALRSSRNGAAMEHLVPEPATRARDYVLDVVPRKRLEDLFLTEHANVHAESLLMSSSAPTCSVPTVWNRVTGFCWSALRETARPH